MSKVTLELRISPEMSCLHKIQVKKSGSSVKTEKVKDHRKKEVNAFSKICLCYTDSNKSYCTKFNSISFSWFLTWKNDLENPKSCWNSNLKRFLTLRQGNPSDPHLGGRHCTDCDIWRGMAGWGLYCLEFSSGFWKEQTNWDALESKSIFSLIACLNDYWNKLNIFFELHSYVLFICIWIWNENLNKT